MHFNRIVQKSGRDCPWQDKDSFKKKGFTLIEITIVVVVIALIIGGVLLGRDLISAAKAISQVSQFSQYQHATEIFESKYNALPGDMPPELAATLQFQVRAGTSGRGDNSRNYMHPNSLLTDFYVEEVGYEKTLYWRDLSESKLIPETFNTATDACPPITAGEMELYFPRAKLDDGSHIFLYSGGNEQKNYYELTKMVAVAASLSCMPTRAHATRPAIAYMIDSKMDDGLPRTGSVLSGHFLPGLIGPTGGGAFGCVMNAGGQVVYRTDQVNSSGCSLTVEAGFGK